MKRFCSGFFITIAFAVPAATQVPETGTALWVRSSSISLQNLTANSSGMPEFGIGHRGERYSIGVGFGWVGFSSSEDNSSRGGFLSKDDTDISVFQIGPVGALDFWQSDDGMTRGSVAGTVSLGRISVNDRDEFTAPGFPRSTNETKTTGTLLGLRVGVGADHFLDRHFAVGFEAGLEGVFAFDVTEDESTDKLGLGANGTFVGFRATVVF